MRIENVIQGSDQWDEIRRGIPTASNFNRIVTPVKCELSAQWKKYAVELVAQHLKVSSPPALPTEWMDNGIDTEPYGVAAYKVIEGLDDSQIQEVGFVWPDDHQRYGCSPDRLVGDDGLLEVKCPKPETLIAYHLDGGLPNEYKPQVMGQLLITGREWCDFVAYHHELSPFKFRVQRDEEYITNLAIALDEFCDRLEELKEKLIVDHRIKERIDVQLTDDYQQKVYEDSEVQL